MKSQTWQAFRRDNMHYSFKGFPGGKDFQKAEDKMTSNKFFGATLRMILIVVFLCGFAQAATITTISIPGQFNLTGAQWVNSTGATAFGS
jgi:hypothetical protein